MPIVERFTRARVLLVAMMLLQMAWLVAGWLTGIVTHSAKILPLLLYTAVVGGAILLLPGRIEPALGAFKRRLIRDDRLLLGGLCLAFVAACLLLAGWQRVWRDERWQLQAASIVAEQGLAPFFAGYGELRWLGPQHPPLAPLLYGSFMRLVGVEVLRARLVGVALATGTLLITYRIAAELYGRDRGLWAALFVASMPLILLQGAAAMTDIPVTFAFCLALLLALRLARRPSYWLAAALGIVVALGLLTKYTMALLAPVLIGWYAASGRFRQARRYLVAIVLVPAGLAAAWAVYAYGSGVLAAQVTRVLWLAGAAVRGTWGIRFLLDSLVMNLPSSIGVYNLPWLGLGVWAVVRRRTEPDRLVLVWVVTVFVLVSVTLPGYRYYMPAFPGLAVLMAEGLERLPEARCRALALALLYCAGALALLVDWQPVGYLFAR